MKKTTYLVPSLRVVYLPAPCDTLTTASAPTTDDTISDDDDDKQTRRMDWNFEWQ